MSLNPRMFFAGPLIPQVFYYVHLFPEMIYFWPFILRILSSWRFTHQMLFKLCIFRMFMNVKYSVLSLFLSIRLPTFFILCGVFRQKHYLFLFCYYWTR